jgi:predicted permease
MNGFFQDIRFAIRQLRKNLGFTLVAVLTLALGIGANTAIFSVVNSVLIKPLPYPEPQKLVEIFETTPGGSGWNSVSGGAFKDWHSQSSEFEKLAVFEETRQNLTGTGTPERVNGLMVSSEFLPALGVVPATGRGFAAGEDAVGGNNHVVMLTHKLWETHFGGNADVVGKTVALDQIPYTIIGILPANALLQDEAQFLVPDVIDAKGVNWERSGHWRHVVGRLKQDVTVAQATAELRTIKQRLTSQYPSFKKDWSVTVVPLQEVYAGDTRPVLYVLLGTVVLVLLIACANVSNLLLARGNARAREMAIRTALGAHAWRIIRQVLVESMVLALLGCAAGLLIARFGLKALANMFATTLPHILQPTMDSNVLLFSIAAACACGLLFGILPAWRTITPDVNRALKENDRASASRSKKNSQTWLVVSEFALTLMLLAGAGLFLRSFVVLLKTSPGFNPQQTLAFDLSFPKAKYPKMDDRMRFIKGVTAQVAALPGIESVGASSVLPLSGDGTTEYAGRADKPRSNDYIVACTFVSGNYFSAMGMPILRGRGIVDADSGDKVLRVLVVDETVAHDLYPNEDPIGQRLDFLGEKWEIVGLVAPVRQFVLDQNPRPSVFGPQGYDPSSTSIVIRTASTPTDLVQTVRRKILNADPDQPIANIRTLEQDVQKSLATRRTTLLLIGMFAVIAISLACIGIYGVMSYAIGQRKRELSIRSALGAQRRDIVRLVLAGGMKPSVAGIAIGLLAALGLARFIESQLFAVKAHDPLVFAASVGLLTLVSALSVYIPARRAAKSDPMVALRYE